MVESATCSLRSKLSISLAAILSNVPYQAHFHFAIVVGNWYPAVCSKHFVVLFQDQPDTKIIYRKSSPIKQVFLLQLVVQRLTSFICSLIIFFFNHKFIFILLNFFDTLFMATM